MNPRIPPELDPALIPAAVVRPTRIDPNPSTSRVPIHPLAALVLLGVDNLWNLAEWAVVDWIITIPLSFFMVAVPTFCLQKFLRRDGVGRAMAFSLLLGVIAAIPFSVFGTPVGLALLAWMGIDRLIGHSQRPGV
jgi:hypothetical protein